MIINTSLFVSPVKSLSAQLRDMPDAELANQLTLLREQVNNGELLDGLMVRAFSIVFQVLERQKISFDESLLETAIFMHQGFIANVKPDVKNYIPLLFVSYLNALSGEPVYLITPHDRISHQIATNLMPLADALGMSVSVLKSGVGLLSSFRYNYSSLLASASDSAVSKAPVRRKEAYSCDIIVTRDHYLIFDYLRDHLAWEVEKVLQTVNRCRAFFVDAAATLIENARSPFSITESSGNPIRTHSMQTYFQKFDTPAGLITCGDINIRDLDEIYGLRTVDLCEQTGLISPWDIELYTSEQAKLDNLLSRLVSLLDKQMTILLGFSTDAYRDSISNFLNRHEIPFVIHDGPPSVTNLKPHVHLCDVDETAAAYLLNDPAPDQEICVIIVERSLSRRRDLSLAELHHASTVKPCLMLSLDDHLLALHGGDVVKQLIQFNTSSSEQVTHSMIINAVEQAQIQLEDQEYRKRQNLYNYDQILNKFRNQVYTQWQQWLVDKKNISGSYKKIIGNEIKKICEKYKETYQTELRKREELYKDLLMIFPVPENINPGTISEMPYDELKDTLCQSAEEALDAKQAELESAREGLAEYAMRLTMLRAIDDKWKELIRYEDQQRKKINTDNIQADDILFEQYESQITDYFSDFWETVYQRISNQIFRVQAQTTQRRQMRERQSRDDNKKPVQRTVVRKKDLGRNDPCWCGSGKRYKKCHYREDMIKQRQTKSEQSSDHKPPVRHANVGRNDPCWCGSGKKYKNCHYPS